MFDNVEKMSPEKLVQELRRWHFCYNDAPDNFDARLIKRSIEIIEDLLHALKKNEIQYDKSRDNGSNEKQSL